MKVSHIVTASLVGCILASSAQAAVNFGSASGYAVFATGTTQLSGGTVYGSLITGDSADIHGASISGSVTAGDTIHRTGSTIAGGTFINSTVDFSAAHNEFKQYSSLLAGLDDNGTVTSAYGGITLTGTSDTINIFSLDASDLKNAWGITVNAKSGSTVVINISGESVKLSAWLQGSGVTAGNVVLNFHQAKSLTLQGNTFSGAILAADADTQLKNGNLNGSVLTSHFTASSYSLNSMGYNNGSGISPSEIAAAIASVPEPATVSVLGIVALALLHRPRRR